MASRSGRRSSVRSSAARWRQRRISPWCPDSNTGGTPGRGRGRALGHFKGKNLMKFRSENATLSLGAVKPEGFRVRLRVSPFAAPTTPVSLVVVSLQVGDQTYTAPLICRPNSKFTLAYTN